ncbi:MAG: trypsin-like peptidase domain-containing protein [Thermoplasmata archaeon]|nr:trypsin-like peptidase domain-containing protein [Thermoplasmata archaeon]
MSLAELESELTGAVERLRPSVVRVESFGRQEGAGSGLAIAPLRHIVTNAHVLRGASRVAVRSPEGDRIEAEIVGADAATDVAVVRVPHGHWPVAPFGDSERLRVGQFVVAVGNSLGLPGEPTVSLGVVSALGRTLPGTDFIFEGLLQTDAAINPGNSGGPLADLRGAVVGLNTAMVPFAQGVGFAVPINTVRHVAEQIVHTGHVVRPWLGITGSTLDAQAAAERRLSSSSGVLVREIAPSGPAAEAGLSPGDVLRRVAGTPVRSLRELLQRLSSLPVGGSIDLEFERRGFPRRAVVRLAEAPVLRGRAG